MQAINPFLLLPKNPFCLFSYLPFLCPRPAETRRHFSWPWSWRWPRLTWLRNLWTMVARRLPSSLWRFFLTRPMNPPLISRVRGCYFLNKVSDFGTLAGRQPSGGRSANHRPPPGSRPPSLFYSETSYTLDQQTNFYPHSLPIHPFNMFLFYLGKRIIIFK